LHQKLWPSDTFVDFDVGLNSAIRKLRQALNDDADHPHYIETLAKRGYRFLAPVIELGAKDPEEHPQPTPDVATASDTSLLTSSVPPSPAKAEPRSTQRLDMDRRCGRCRRNRRCRRLLVDPSARRSDRGSGNPTDR